MPRVSNAFEDYTSIKPLNKKNKRNKFFIMFLYSLLMLIQTLDHSSHCKREKRLAVQVILEVFLNGLAKSPSVLRSSSTLN